MEGLSSRQYCGAILEELARREVQVISFTDLKKDNIFRKLLILLLKVRKSEVCKTRRQHLLRLFDELGPGAGTGVYDLFLLRLRQSGWLGWIPAEEEIDLSLWNPASEYEGEWRDLITQSADVICEGTEVLA